MTPAFLLAVLSACLHAGWNLIAHRHRTSPSLMLRIPLVVGLVGLLPVLIAELRAPVLTPKLAGLLALTGAAQAVYYVALLRAYQRSDFSLVYPLGRALPVLLLAGFDLARGHGLSARGAAGLLLVVLGCALLPLASRGGGAGSGEKGATAFWIALVAVSTAAYTIVDKLALELLPPGPSTAARWCVAETLAMVPFVWLAGARRGEPDAGPGHDGAASEPKPRAAWWWTALAAAFTFGSYGLILWAYQMSGHTSYVTALRQISIPLGVVLAGPLLGERVTGLRLAAAAVITVGVACVLSA